MPHPKKQKSIVMEMEEDGFELDPLTMEQFVKDNTKKRYISEKPKP